MKKLKVFSYPWHSCHQYSLIQLPFFERYDFLVEPYKKGLAESQRPFSKFYESGKIRDVTHYTPGEYDLAILHVDQQCIWNPDKGDRIAKGRIYMEINDLIQDIPKIVINHMVPIHDKYDGKYVIKWFKDILDGNTVIVNSHEARKQWGFGRTIHHGLEAEEWFDLPKEPRVGIVLSPAGMEKAYRREFIRAVLRRLEENKVPYEWIGVTRKSLPDFETYREWLGKNLVFFMGTRNSPMPRSRTEAMLSGCCVVTTPYQDADTFIHSGELKGEDIIIDDDTNGFLTSMSKIKDPRMMDNPDYTADLISRLVLEQPDIAIQVGQQGKKTAQEKFSKLSFEKQWEKLLKDLNLL